jgi:hypothetical protein
VWDGFISNVGSTQSRLEAGENAFLPSMQQSFSITLQQITRKFVGGRVLHTPGPPSASKLSIIVQNVTSERLFQTPKKVTYIFMQMIFYILGSYKHDMSLKFLFIKYNSPKG